MCKYLYFFLFFLNYNYYSQDNKVVGYYERRSDSVRKAHIEFYKIPARENKVTLNAFGHTFKEYKELFKSSMNYFCDSIQRDDTHGLFIKVLIKNINSTDKEFKIVYTYSWSSPIPSMLFTHVIYSKNKVILFYFEENVSNELTNELGMSFINNNDISKIQKLSNKYNKGSTVTGRVSCFVTSVSDSVLISKWYTYHVYAPEGDRFKFEPYYDLNKFKNKEKLINMGKYDPELMKEFNEFEWQEYRLYLEQKRIEIH